MANAFKTSGWPMLLILAEATAFNTSRAYNEPQMGTAAEGRWPHLRRAEAAPIVRSAGIKSIGLR